MRSDIAQGNGIYKSSDGGRSLDAPRARRHAADRAHPGRPARCGSRSASRRSAIPTARTPSAASSSPATAARAGSKVLYKDDDTGAIDLAFEPGNPNVVYAALWQTRRPPWSVYPPSNGPGSGLFKSHGRRRDVGADSARAACPRGTAGSGWPWRPAAPIASTRSSTPEGRRPVPLRRRRRHLDAGQRRPAHLGAGLVLRRHRGGAAGCRRGLRLQHRAVSLARRRPDLRPAQGRPDGRRLPRAVDRPRRPDAPHPRHRPGRGRVARTAARPGAPGTTSRPASSTTSRTDNASPTGSTARSRTRARPGCPAAPRSGDGINLMHFREITAGGESDNIAPDPKDPEHRLRRPRRAARPAHAADAQSSTPRSRSRDVERSTWTLPLVFSRRDPRVLYFANQRLFRTDDGGEHWTVDQPRPDAAKTPACRAPRRRDRRRYAAAGPPARRHLRDRPLAPAGPRALGRARTTG